MLNSAAVGAGRMTRGACATTAACSGVMVWCMGAVSGESAGGRGAVNDDLLVMADCSLVLGRRSVFILTCSRLRARREGYARDLSQMIARADRRWTKKDEGRAALVLHLTRGA